MPNPLISGYVLGFNGLKPYAAIQKMIYLSLYIIAGLP
jgi:hypothetical protein